MAAISPERRAGRSHRYFAFTESLTIALLVPAAFGILPTVYAMRVGTMDNIVAPVHGLVCLLWVFGFCKYWRRRCNELAFEWHVEDYSEIERLRPQFVASADTVRMRAGQERLVQSGQDDDLEEEALATASDARGGAKPGLYTPEGYFVDVADEEGRVPAATGTQGRPLREPRLISSFDRLERSRRVATSWILILLLTFIAILATELLMILRTFLMAYFDSQPEASFEGWPFASFIFPYRVYVGAGLAGLATTTWITVTNSAFASVATWLTEWENHMTPTHHDNMLIYKQFVFQFINSNASLFYIAFVKGQSRMSNRDEGQYITFLFPYAQAGCH